MGDVSFGQEFSLIPFIDFVGLDLCTICTCMCVICIKFCRYVSLLEGVGGWPGADLLTSCIHGFLVGFEKGIGSVHIMTLDAVHSLGMVYTGRGKLSEAEKVFLRALS